MSHCGRAVMWWRIYGEEFLICYLRRQAGNKICIIEFSAVESMIELRERLLSVSPALLQVRVVDRVLIVAFTYAFAIRSLCGAAG